MLQRSLFVFLGFVFLTLLLTVGYAIAGLSGPESNIREATRSLQAGRYADAVRTLDMAQRGLKKTDVDLLQQLLRLRAQALAEVGNRPLALADLDRLREFYDGPQLGIEKERIELMIRMGRGKDALRAANDILAKSEEAARDSRLFELLGEAEQATYQKLVEDLKTELRQKLPARSEERRVGKGG